MDAFYDKCASILVMPINMFKDIWSFYTTPGQLDKLKEPKATPKPKTKTKTSVTEKVKDAKDVKDAEEYEW